RGATKVRMPRGANQRELDHEHLITNPDALLQPVTEGFSAPPPTIAVTTESVSPTAAQPRIAATVFVPPSTAVPVPSDLRSVLRDGEEILRSQGGSFVLRRRRF